MRELGNADSSVKQAENTIDLGLYFKILKKRKWSIMLFTFVFFSLGVLYLSKATPIYQASVKIQADPVQPNANAQDAFLMNSMIFLFYETQYEIIQSRKVAESVVDKLGLVERFKKEQAELKESGESGGVLSSTKKIIKEFLSSDKPKEDVTTDLTDEKIKIMLAQEIQAGLVVEGGTQSQIINISYQHEDPKLAADIVNAVSEAYIEFGLEARLSQIKDTADWLSEQLDDLRVTLQESEDKLRDFRLSQNLMDTEQQQRIANTQLQTLNTELVRAQTEYSEAQGLYSQIIQLEKQGGSYRSLGPVLQSNTIRDLSREEATLSRKVKELSERYGEKHPKMIAARSDLLSAMSNLDREAAKIVENIKEEYRSARNQIDNIKDLLERNKLELQSYQSESFELTRLEREVENNRRIYESFLSKLMEADVSGEYDASNIRVIDEATNPELPVWPRFSIILLACMILGIGSGVGYALLTELLGSVFRTPDQLEQEVGLASLGITPVVAKARNSIAPELQYIADQRSTFSEAINTIRTGLLFSDIENPPKTILITSSSSGEGKTTLAINLATALSQMDSTLLLELDLRKPAIAKDLNITKRIGISDLIEGSSSELEFSTISEVPNLKVLTCGKIPNNPMEIISSKEFSSLLEKFKAKFKYIVIDSPPTLPVSDSCILAKKVDATLVAVKAEHTKIQMVKETISRLNKVNAKITGVVLTQASPQKMAYYGEHYYQDGYYGVDKS
ncbi:polysaccharide biosynthesis tyrosine autokinase [Alteromonas sp. C1M14]|uniref:GumC family protein n=1 Tax=Alteromonas sp. C1M14 TaxID=2841567 RepID=UPI001C097F2B|nr:polysaccharide biosynthesis tyrosine autokinase [Alteromonas sp. C1M14]MBU2979940.1 polysaccharide biosynthesis tyrosine autokinase [Alteromonas sp. C1M14]